MDEILKKLLESEVLSEETKAELQTQFKSAVDTFLSEERAKLEADVTAKLTEEFVTARAELAEALNSKVDALLKTELDELKEDIERYRDLEVEYAEKLVEEKESLAQKLSEELDQLVDKVDAYLDYTLNAELSELKEDIDQVKKLEFGRRIFEAMETEFKTFRKGDLDGVERDLAETKDKLAEATSRLAEIERDRLAEARVTKLEELLSPLAGTAREQMKMILSNVATEKLDEAYKVYLTRVLKETSAAAAGKVAATAPVISEAKVTLEDVKNLATVTGNEGSGTEETILAEETPSSNLQLLRVRKLAGLA